MNKDLIEIVRGLKDDCINLQNGLIKALVINTDLDLDGVVDKVVDILEKQDVSDLTFDRLDLSNDIRTIEDFEKVLFTDGVVWRKYLSSISEFDGLLFGNGHYLSNFRWYGFQYSGNLRGTGDCGSYYSHTFGEVSSYRTNKETKLELIRPVVQCADWDMYVSNKEEIEKFLDWFVHFLNPTDGVREFDDDLFSDYTGIKYETISTEGKTFDIEGFDWKFLGEEDGFNGRKYCRFETVIPLEINEEGFFVNGEKCLSRLATEVLVGMEAIENQMIAVIHSKYPQLKYMSYRFIKNDKEDNIKTISAFK